ncbi:MAG: hypothetical protein KBI40_04655 [Firmicutes bacterium]|jgi:chromatin segregation and condensation protein Rec8/ScpA/Scc1 (kleisin family)|nr:hypothetical protein [Candidatus Fermentithermobacillaceae bacterium]
MSVLQLAPLCRTLREQVENGAIMLDDSVDLLVDASFLVLAKVKWLLPQSKVQEHESCLQEIDEDSIVQEESVPVLLDEEEFMLAIEEISDLMLSSEYMYDRGYVSCLADSHRIETAAIDVSELTEVALRLLSDREQPRHSVLVLKRSFSEHLRWFWKEVTKLASQHNILSFSLFADTTKQACILNFLVLLELIKRRKVFAKQPEEFGDIVFTTKRQDDRS